MDMKSTLSINVIVHQARPLDQTQDGNNIAFKLLVALSLHIGSLDTWRWLKLCSEYDKKRKERIGQKDIKTPYRRNLQ